MPPLFGGVDPARGRVDRYRNLLNGICRRGLFGGRGDPGSKTGPAVSAAEATASVGFIAPMFVQLMFRRPIRGSGRGWLMPNEWLLASSPTSLILVVTGAGLSWRLDDAVTWMIEIQLRRARC